jgi:hypothetical protein
MPKAQIIFDLKYIYQIFKLMLMIVLTNQK